jgi:hypothetical protein
MAAVQCVRVGRGRFHVELVNDMRFLFALFLLVGSPLSEAGQEVYRFREANPLSQTSGEMGYAKLNIDEPQLHRGERYSVEYTFYNTRGSYWLYNWAFNGLVPLPGQLAIYDSKKEYIGDLLRFVGGSRRTVGDNDWVFLHEGSHLGRRIELTAGYVPGTPYDSMRNLLPAGHYYIQLILYRAFLSPNPTHLEGDKPDFYKTFDRSELLRSNAIEIDIS